MAKQWNQEKNSVKHKLGKHQRVRSRKIRRSGGQQAVDRPAWPFSSSVGFNILRGDAPLNSKVESRELIQVLCTHSIRLSSLHCLRTSKRSSMGGGGVSASCCQWFWGAKIKKEKKGEKKEKNDDEKLLGSVCFVKLQVLSRLFYTQLFQPCAIQ